MRRSWWLRRGPAITVSVVTIGAGTGQLILSRQSSNTHAWMSSVLANTSTETLLLVPILLLGQWFGRSFERLREESRTEAQDLRSQIGDVRAEVASILDEMSANVAARVNERATIDIGMYAELQSNPSFANVFSALANAVSRRLVSSQGLWLDIPHTGLTARWRPVSLGENGDSGLLVEVVDPTWLSAESLEPVYRPIARLMWTAKETAEDFLVKLGESLQRAKIYPGDAAFHPAAMFEAMREILTQLLRRQSGVGGIASPIPPVIQVFEQWALTEECLTDFKGNHGYRVGLDRLNEMDWDEHMSGKAWVQIGDFRQAMRAAIHLIEEGVLKGSISKNSQ
jgi:hypothetical protein